jgi:hypothetical protein
VRARFAPSCLLALLKEAAGDDSSSPGYRPPRLTDKPLTGAYRIAYGRNLRRGLLVSRADVAHLMLRMLGQPETIK